MTATVMNIARSRGRAGVSKRFQRFLWPQMGLPWQPRRTTGKFRLFTSMAATVMNIAFATYAGRLLMLQERRNSRHRARSRLCQSGRARKWSMTFTTQLGTGKDSIIATDGSAAGCVCPDVGGRCQRTNICARSAGRSHSCDRWRSATCRPPARNAARVLPVSS